MLVRFLTVVAYKMRYLGSLESDLLPRSSLV